MTRSSERDRIDLLARVLSSADERTLLGIGDDAAVLAGDAIPLVVTVDAAFDGVHFRRDLASPFDVGYRSTMAAASDLAAMGAVPLALVCALGLPESFADEDLTELARGQRAAADELGAPLVGGNLSRASELSLTTTALGRAASPLTRSGARAEDVLVVAGSLGLAGLGFRLLDRGGSGDEAAAPALAAWLHPRARVAEGLRLSGVARAAIDVSDGLARDVGHLARASGLRALLDAEQLVEPELAAAAAAAGLPALHFALHGGEDYALLAALPPGTSVEGFRAIGRFTADPEGVWLRASDGTIERVDEQGFDHFAKADGGAGR